MSIAVDDLILSGDPKRDALLFGTKWQLAAGQPLTYSFATSSSTWEGYAAGSEPFHGFGSLGETGQDAVRWALAEWARIANLEFIEIDENSEQTGALRFAYTTLGMDAYQLGYSYAPSNQPQGGDVWLNGQLKTGLYASFEPGSLSGYAVLHELGHALGLKHPHEASTFNSAILDSPDDYLANSVESYFSQPGIVLTRTHTDRLPSTPMALDIDALHFLYGANITDNSDDNIYSYDAGASHFQTLYDPGGIDTILARGNRNVEIDLRPGEWSKLGPPSMPGKGKTENPDTIRIHGSTLIENATGGDGNDLLIGNEADNVLTGDAGKDTLTGGAGADVFVLSHLARGSFDRIVDFTAGDQLRVDTGIFTRLTGADVSNLAVGRHGRDADDYLVYAKSRGVLYYDADGSGKEHALIKIAQIKGPDAKTLSFDDFIFI